MQKVGRQVLGPVPIVETEGSRETRSWNSKFDTLNDSSPPAGLGFVDGNFEKVVKQQVLKVGLGAVGLGDIRKEDRADDAPTTPHEGDGRVVQLPFVFFGSLSIIKFQFRFKR